MEDIVELIVLAVVMIAFLVVTSTLSKKKQQAQRDMMNEKMVPGAWVQTIGGFCGKIVEIDGDVVVLATPSGEETLWLAKAIARVEEPPFAIEEETEEEKTQDTENEVSSDENLEQGTEEATDSSVETVEVAEEKTKTEE